MRRVLVAAWLNLCLAMQLFSQDYGIQWVQGDVPVSIMDFRNDTVQFHFITDSPNVAMFIGTANICNKQGEFLFFTNGIYVRDRYGNMMPNGDSLCYSEQWYTAFNNVYQTIYPNGLPSAQSVMILPKPGNDNLYYIFHYLTTDTSYLLKNMVQTAPLVLYYSLVGMNENFGLGAVIEKNVRLPIYQPMCSSRMTAVKHGNGRDWWLVRHGDRDNTYIKFLITPNEIDGPYFQKIGPSYNRDNLAIDYYGASVFSLAGDKMASSNFWGPIVVLDFDRCNGEFSNPITINNMLEDTTWYGAAYTTLSPNGRFLYANNVYGLNQYDLWSSNINDSVRLYTRDSTDPYWLSAMQLAPNGKIYIAKWNGGSYALHVINKPDEYGWACDFEFNGQQCITANTVNLPNMVNYKLGTLVGSACDTIINSVSGLSGDKFKVSISPNPASDKVDIVIKGSKEDLRMMVYNNLGEIVGNAVVNHYVEFDVSNFTNGVYQVCFISPNGTVSSSRLVVAK
ncbi:MAG: T9SS type A sorting domain-containing protein [Bacteroidetes bacterium]|nr:T9SS type A sorting domain-containing protein [Bacteroidota bacterium]